MNDTTETVEISTESLEVLKEEAEAVFLSVQDPEWQEQYGPKIAEAVEEAEAALTE